MRWHAVLILALGGAACRGVPSISVEWVPGNPDSLRASADHRMLLRSWGDHFDVVDAVGQIVALGEPGQRAIGAPDALGRVVVLQPGGDVTGRDRKPLTRIAVPTGAKVVDAADGDICAVVWPSPEHADRTEIVAFSCSHPGSPMMKSVEQSQSLATAIAGQLVLTGQHAGTWTLTVLDTKLDTTATAALPGTPAAIAAGTDSGQVLLAIAGADRLRPPRFFTTAVPAIALSELTSERSPRSIVAGCDVTAIAPSGKNTWIAACAQRDHMGQTLFSYIARLDGTKQIATSAALVDAKESTSWITGIATDEHGRILVAGVKGGDHDVRHSSN